MYKLKESDELFFCAEINLKLDYLDEEILMNVSYCKDNRNNLYYIIEEFSGLKVEYFSDCELNILAEKGLHLEGYPLYLKEEDMYRQIFLASRNNRFQNLR
jgi:hypothetical protein